MSPSRYERVRLVLHVMLGLSIVSWGAGGPRKKRTHLRGCPHLFLMSRGPVRRLVAARARVDAGPHGRPGTTG